MPVTAIWPALPPDPPPSLRLIGGLDITPVYPSDPWVPDSGAPWPPPPEPAVAAAVVVSLPDLRVVYEDAVRIHLQYPYIPTYLGFREVPAFEELVARAVAAGVAPHLWLVDGFGGLHPRRAGSATHLGVAVGVPTAGVAKHLLHVEGLSEAEARAETAAALQEHAHQLPIATPLVSHATWEVLGAAVAGLGASGSTRLLYVSAGHLASLGDAVAAVAATCVHGTPEPIRQADIRSREGARRWAAELE